MLPESNIYGHFFEGEGVHIGRQHTLSKIVTVVTNKTNTERQKDRKTDKGKKYVSENGKQAAHVKREVESVMSEQGRGERGKKCVK